MLWRIRASKMPELFLALAVISGASYGSVRADEPKPSFQVTKNHVDRIVGRGEPDIEYIGVQNTGKAVITTLTYEGEFTDSKSGAIILIPPTAAELPPGGIQPSDQVSIKVKMCTPVWAGSYSGSLVLTSPSADAKSLGVVIRSRGPLPNVPFGQSPFYEFPAILFLLVVVAGFGASSLLDQWMGTDLPRLRALQSLKSSQANISNVSDRLHKWPLDHPSLTQFSSALNRMAILLPDLVRVIADATQATPADLTAASQLYSVVSGKLFIFSSALDQIESLYSQKGNDPLTLAYLNSAIKRLDALDFSDASPVATFRTNVVTALATTGAAGAIAAAPAAPNGALPQAAQIEDTQKKIERQIRLIALAQHAVIWVVVALTAIATYFLANSSYGSAADYIGTLLWSLGLTQTGKQIIARTH